MPDHIKFKRETKVASRRPVKRFPPPIQPPVDIDGFFKKTKGILDDFRAYVPTQTGAYDERRLVKLQLDNSLSADKIREIDGLEFIDQDDEGVIVALASDRALAVFEEKLSSIMKREEVKKADVLYALQSLSAWSSEDRKGPRLKSEPLPQGKFFVDVELWSHDNNYAEIKKMRDAFEAWLKEKNIPYTDKLVTIPYYRLEVDAAGLDIILNHRDVRFVDLLPKYGIEAQDLSIDIKEFEDAASPEEGAGVLAILDTGITSGHPFIKNALADAQTFISASPEDDNGHGTEVAGIGLYGDIKASIDAKSFVPKLWILSGRVLDDQNQYERKIILNSITDAVDYFLEHYDCRVYNLSFGDAKYPYKGGRLRALAVGLDQISREKSVLFVISSGNFVEIDNKDIQNNYPLYLLSDEAKILDPATAINAITVGSIAEYNKPAYAPPEKITHQPIAEVNHPSPFTRSGPSIKGIIKPDFVDYGGNYLSNLNLGSINKSQLGQIVINHDFFKEGKLFKLAAGTSISAPKVANLAARLYSLIPDASPNTIRAILGAHSEYPLSEAQKDSLVAKLSTATDKGYIHQVYGLGKVNDEWLFSSGEESATIYAEDQISNDENHFYELPLPKEFISGKARIRNYSVALAYTPSVRPSRLDYAATRISFRLKYASSLDEVASVFSDKENAIKMNEDTVGNIQEIGSSIRSKGTLQVSQFLFKGNPRKLSTQKLFMAVIRQDRPWAKGGEDVLPHEKYSIALNFQDRESEEADLYNSISAQLQAREQNQARERIRGRIRGS